MMNQSRSLDWLQNSLRCELKLNNANVFENLTARPYLVGTVTSRNGTTNNQVVYKTSDSDSRRLSRRWEIDLRVKIDICYFTVNVKSQISCVCDWHETALFHLQWWCRLWIESLDESSTSRFEEHEVQRDQKEESPKGRKQTTKSSCWFVWMRGSNRESATHQLLLQQCNLIKYALLYGHIINCRRLCLMLDNNMKSKFTGDWQQSWTNVHVPVLFFQNQTAVLL